MWKKEESELDNQSDFMDKPSVETQEADNDRSSAEI